MGKMTDALKKAGLLKERKDVVASPQDAFSQTPEPKPETEEPPAAPPPLPKQEKPTPPELRLVARETPTIRSSPVPKIEPTPAGPTAGGASKMTSLIFPRAEPEVKSTPAEAVEERPVLPEVEPTPIEVNRTYLSTHYSKDDRTADEFRQLKSRLAAEAAPAQVILVVSCSPDEGKTTLATNLAVSFANTYGEKVVLIDGNLSRPRIGEVLALGEDGLGEVIRGHIRPEESAVKTEIPGLWAVPAGRSGDRSEGLLDSRPVKELIKQCRRRFTRVIMELPAECDAADALAPVSQADVVIIPVMRSRSRRKDLCKLIERAGNHGARNVHCVFIDA